MARFLPFVAVLLSMLFVIAFTAVPILMRRHAAQADEASLHAEEAGS